MNIPPGYAQVNLVHSGIALPRGAQLTFGLNNSINPQTATTVGNIVAGVWRGHLRALMATNARLDTIRVKLGPNATGPEAEITVGDNGDRSNDPDSPQVAVLVSKRGELGGRQNRGRWFMPYCLETDTISGGRLGPAAQTLFQNAVDAWLAEMIVTTLLPVILHNSIELTPTPITSMPVQTQVATQRRRLRKVGGRRVIP